MSVLKYIKQPLSLSLAQYTDAELRKIEASIFSIETAILDINGVRAVKEVATSRASTTTLADDPDLSIPLIAGIWDIRLMQMWGGASTTPGLKFVLLYSGTLTVVPPAANGHNLGTGSCRLYDSSGGPGTASTATLGVVNRIETLPHVGAFEVATAGNLTLQWSQNFSNANPTILYPGSFISARKLA